MIALGDEVWAVWVELNAANDYHQYVDSLWPSEAEAKARHEAIKREAAQPGSTIFTVALGKYIVGQPVPD